MDIYPFSNGYSTAYLVVDNGNAMLVDAATADIAPRIISKLQEVNARLGLIVLTHFHFDHIGAADLLRQQTGAPVAIHRLDADALRLGGRLAAHPTGVRGRIVARFLGHQNASPLIPDLEFGDEEDLSVQGGIGRSFWTPGHTAGSQSVALPDGTVLAGDALTENFVPLRAAAGPIFADDPAASTRSIVAINDAAQQVRVAHRGLLDPKSLRRLAQHADSRLSKTPKRHLRSTAPQLRRILLIAGTALVLQGISNLAAGPWLHLGETITAGADSDARFLGAVLVGIGTTWIYLSRRPLLHTVPIRLIAGGLLLGAGSRLLSWAIAGPPPVLMIPITIIEFLVPTAVILLSLRAAETTTTTHPTKSSPVASLSRLR